MKSVEAIIGPDGLVRPVEPIVVSAPTRAIVTILESTPPDVEAATLSEPALADDWLRPEEEAAWAHLQPEASS